MERRGRVYVVGQKLPLVFKKGSPEGWYSLRLLVNGDCITAIPLLVVFDQSAFLAKLKGN